MDQVWEHRFNGSSEFVADNRPGTMQVRLNSSRSAAVVRNSVGKRSWAMLGTPLGPHRTCIVQ